MTEAMAEPKTKELLARLGEIPTLPLVATEVSELIHDPKVSAGAIAESLKKDQVLTGKILKLANSSYYAIPGGVADVHRALSFLGFNTVSQLVLSVSIVSIFKKLELSDLTLLDFWKHSLGAAVAAEEIQRFKTLPQPEVAFTCGLLHDIGKLVLHEIAPHQIQICLEAAQSEQTSIAAIEERENFPGHAWLGAATAEKWGLPSVIQQAILLHHTSLSHLPPLEVADAAIVQATYLGNLLALKLQIGKSGDASSGKILEQDLSAAKITGEELKKIELKVVQKMEKAGALLNVIAG